MLLLASVGVLIVGRVSVTMFGSVARVFSRC